MEGPGPVGNKWFSNGDRLVVDPVIHENETAPAGWPTCGPRSTMAHLASALPVLPRSPTAAAALLLGAAPSRALRTSLLRRGSLACRLCSASAAAAAAAAATAAAVEEARIGRKQLGMTLQLYEYLLANVREHPVRSRPPIPLRFRFFESIAAISCSVLTD
jgi:hypothetical protein